MKKLLPASKGFTLIELLVVITIIAFLSVIGFASYTTVQKNARDARRRADIETISTALEANTNSADGTYKVWTDTSIYSNGVQPDDPDPAKDYTVTPGTAGATTYIACADLEKDDGNATSAAGAGIGTTTTGGFFCLKNRQ